MTHRVDVLVIGAGQAGLAASYLLGQEGIPHRVLERGAIGESWRSQRWDSFCLNTPNWSNGMPGMDFHPEAPDAFARRDQVVDFFQSYAAAHGLPVKEDTPVTELRLRPDGRFLVRGGEEEFLCRAVIVASGGMSAPKVPDMASRISPQILTLSAATYRNPGALPPGGILVIGTAQSGCQIAEDLLAAGKRVHVAVSKVGRVPRTYRGRDVFAWLRDTGFLDVQTSEVKDPAMAFAANPQVSGTAGGHTVSLQSLARDGATLVGRVTEVAGHAVKLEPNVRAAIAFADEASRAVKADIDRFIARHGLQAEPARPDPGEPPLPDLHGSDELVALDLKREGIHTVIWCTGYGADWRWIKIDILGPRGQPRHREGIGEVPGLYFLGLPWLSKRKSSILYGAGEDALRVVENLCRYLG